MLWYQWQRSKGCFPTWFLARTKSFASDNDIWSICEVGIVLVKQSNYVDNVSGADDFVHATNHAEKQPLLAYYVVFWRGNDLKWKSHNFDFTWTRIYVYDYLRVSFQTDVCTDDKIWIKGNKMRSENYVYFWTNPYIKLYTLCMADIVMLACVDRLAGWRVIAWNQGPVSRKSR